MGAMNAKAKDLRGHYEVEERLKNQGNRVHYELVHSVNNILNGKRRSDGSPDPQFPGARDQLKGKQLERICTALIVGVYSGGDTTSGSEKVVRKQSAGKITEERVIVPSSMTCGHILMTGLPGAGKTHLGKVASSLFGLSFGRFQMTPDKTPREITVYASKEGDETFINYSALFNNMVLADEINRATPKTQSALLEGMSEGSVSFKSKGTDITEVLPHPFIVMGTQNPLEHEGTYPLPEAQLDRFMLNILFPLADKETIIAILRFLKIQLSTMTRPVTNAEQILRCREFIWNEIEVSEEIEDYIADLIVGCYDPLQFKDIFPSIHERSGLVKNPPNVRAAMHLRNASKTLAAIRGSRKVEVRDVKKRFYEIVNHRFILNENLRGEFAKYGGRDEFVRLLVLGDKERDMHGILDVVPVPE